MYREFDFDLDGAVVWSQTPSPYAPVAGRQRLQRILPDGCLDLLWIDGALVVAGPDTTAYLAPQRPDATYLGVRFAPGQAHPILGVPAHELRDCRVPLDALWPAPDAHRLADRIAAAGLPSGPDGPHAIAAAVGELIRRVPPDPFARNLAGKLRGGVTVGRAADRVNLSPRQLHRRCLVAFGYGPKTLARVLRFNTALALARSGAAFAAIAATAGYADQAHLSREVRALAGVPLSALITAA